MSIRAMATRTLESLPSVPSKFTKSLPCDIYTANITQTNLMRTPRPVHNAVYSHVYPEHAPDPQVLAVSKPALQQIGLDEEVSKTEEFVSVFSGNKILPETRPWSLCYAGHQFGRWQSYFSFETINPQGESWEIQLKGAGRTPYSRFGDGYAVLRSSIREFLMSEHMHALGVPTTRALALIETSRDVFREDGPRGSQPETGAIVARMAPSWLRFGNFEIFYSRDDMDNVKRLADYTIKHVVKDDHHPEVGNQYARLFRTVTEKTAQMVAEWQAIGFNHGVMNTDNMSVLGLTMDYGPFQIMDYYNPFYVCNHSDEAGRYAFHRQPSAAMFNLVKFSVPLFELIGAGEEVDSIVFPDKDNELKEGVTDEETLERYRDAGKMFVQTLLNTDFKHYFMVHLIKKMRSKIGLGTTEDSQSDMDDVIIPLLDWMTAYHVDYHRFYRSLSNYQITSAGEEADADQAIHQWLDIVTEESEELVNCKESLKPWLSIYRHRLLKDKLDHAERKRQMDAVNPRFVLRNSIAEEVIQAFEEEEEAKSQLEACLYACLHPFEQHYEDERIERWIQTPVPAKDMRCSCSS